MPASYEYTRTVHWAECDAANIIFFGTYARWLSEGMDHLMIATGIPHGLRVRPGVHLGFPVVSTFYEYKSPARLYDQVLHRVEVKSVGRKSLKLEHSVHRNGTLLMRADETRVLAEYSPETGEFSTVEISPEYRERLGEVVTV